MTAAELIKELQAMPPHAQVRVMTQSLFLHDEAGEHELDLTELDATEADDVRHMGAYVLVRGK